MNYYSARPRIPMVVKNLIIINIIMFVFTFVSKEFMYETFSLFYVESPLFHPFQFISYMFMHGNFTHIFFNMFALYMFGSVLENIWGSKKFFIYYMVTGIGAALVHEGVQYLQVLSNPAELFHIMRIPTVGASGSVFGLLLAYGMLFPNNIISLIIPPISLKAKWFVLIYGAIEFFFGITGTNIGVAHFAHLGGMLFGILLILYWKKKNRLYY
ncbi:MAG: rhomboid family intramembrane serine protease [Bacteroidales bacterium]|nr:rhomboid family intramembrane serine protease [Bacteroidales bacterium]